MNPMTPRFSVSPPVFFTDLRPALYSEHMLADLLSLDKKLFLELLLGSDRESNVSVCPASISRLSD